MAAEQIVEPTGMLSQHRAAGPAAKYASRALRRSSSLSDHAPAAGFLPVVAKITIDVAVVLPPPRRPAVTKKAGLSGRNQRCKIESAAAIRMHLPEKSVAT